MDPKNGALCSGTPEEGIRRIRFKSIINGPNKCANPVLSFRMTANRCHINLGNANDLPLAHKPECQQ